MKLPKAEQKHAAWQAATEALIMAAEGRGPLMHPRIGVMRALNRRVERVFNPDRKDPHWGRRKLGSIGALGSGGRFEPPSLPDLRRLVDPRLGDLLAADVGLFLQHMIDDANVDHISRRDLLLILAAESCIQTSTASSNANLVLDVLKLGSFSLEPVEDDA